MYKNLDKEIARLNKPACHTVCEIRALRNGFATMASLLEVSSKIIPNALLSIDPDLALTAAEHMDENKDFPQMFVACLLKARQKIDNLIIKLNVPESEMKDYFTKTRKH